MNARLEAGAAVTFRGETFLVVGFAGDGQVHLRDAAGGEERLMQTVDLVSDPTFKVEGAEQRVLTPAQVSWDRLDPALQGDALEREEHLQEILTGYRLGRPDARFQGEPREAYRDTTRAQRITAKAAELGVSYRQVNRWLKAYSRAGQHPAALIDRNATRSCSRLGQQESCIADAIMRVAKERREDSDLSYTRLRELVRRELESMGHEEVALPSQPTFNKLVRRFAPELTHDAKRRRSDASRGTRRPFGKVASTRPGQYVQIDITPFDILARSDVDGRELRLRMVIAVDLYSRAIVAARVMEYEPKGVDLTALILDVINPVRPHPSWPKLGEDANLPFMGIPEGLMLASHHMPEGVPLLNVPPVLPEAVVVDNGMVFLSGQFRDLCQRLGIDIMLARPGTGSDKAHVERLFLHIRQSLAERLQGYVAQHVLARGRHVEAFHFPWEIQFELTQWVARYYNNRPHDGLCHPRTPKVKLTPAEMFAFGVSHAGYMTVPMDRAAFYLALRTELRVISDTGVRIDGWQYDSDVLNPYRNAESQYLELGKKWPFKVDARDPTVIHFQDPMTSEWHEIPERDADWRSRPFQQELVDRVEVAIKERSGTDAEDALAGVKKQLDDDYIARLEKSLKMSQQFKSELKRGEKQDVARREAARDQQEEMTGKPRQALRPAVKAVPQEVDMETAIPFEVEVVGDEF